MTISLSLVISFTVIILGILKVLGWYQIKNHKLRLLELSQTEYLNLNAESPIIKSFVNIAMEKKEKAVLSLRRDYNELNEVYRETLSDYHKLKVERDYALNNFRMCKGYFSISADELNKHRKLRMRLESRGFKFIESEDGERIKYICIPPDEIINLDGVLKTILIENLNESVKDLKIDSLITNKFISDGKVTNKILDSSFLSFPKLDESTQYNVCKCGNAKNKGQFESVYCRICKSRVYFKANEEAIKTDNFLKIFTAPIRANQIRVEPISPEAFLELKKKVEANEQKKVSELDSDFAIKRDSCKRGSGKECGCWNCLKSNNKNKEYELGSHSWKGEEDDRIKE